MKRWFRRRKANAPAVTEGEAGASSTGGVSSRGARSAQAWRVVFPSLLLLFVALMFAAHSLARKQNAADAEYISIVEELKLRSQQIPRAAEAAILGSAQGSAQGVAQGVAGLKRFREEIVSALERFRDGDEARELPPLPPRVSSQLGTLESTWRVMRDDVDRVLSGVHLAAEARELGSNVESLFSQASLTTQEVFGAMVAGNATTEQVSLAGRQLARLERMSNDVARLLDSTARPDATIERLMRDETEFVQANARLLGEDAGAPALSVEDAVARQGLGRLAALFANRATLIDDFVQKSRALIALREAVSSLDANAEPFLQATQALGESYRRVSDARGDYTTAMVVFAMLALGSLLMLGVQLIRDARSRTHEARRHEEESRERNRRNQDAILKLLDEMSELAEGNLTAYATVTEDITGAIADAFNYAIDALRQMVARINHTAERVADSSQASRTRAIQLSVASDKQNAEIIKSTASIQDIAASIEQVSANASESSEVARKSVEFAHRGATAVRETIAGMGEIRETIQETAKRLKRLGESSQEIGNIVGLIDDIADQTNVLALNAAIQASMAGETGRGFAVVADEVQRLAERAGQATKRIEGLVKTIQADTREAIESMEKSTAGVVAGARLAQGAGASLDEIEQVSQTLARLIEAISEASRAQAVRAAAVAEMMNAIRSIAAQTRVGANTTAKSVDNLVQLTEALKSSVAGFRLPESFDPTVVNIHGAAAEGASAAGQAVQGRRRDDKTPGDVRTLRGR
ncbi:MAG: methyl-accepting chemotaxis protein [Gammaproteobacteria bacterium]|nr:methyl-accepting chemotaxis protein [Gammaproteobacteria bacterium]